MIVVEFFELIEEYVDELDLDGYGYSSFHGPSEDDEYDVEEYKDLYRDWGWSGRQEEKPL